VIYHGGCPDGFGGAWAAWKKFGSRAAYLGIPHGKGSDVPPRLAGKEIYLIDFGYSVPHIERLIRENIRVTALDHHVSNEPSIRRTHDYRYATEHSGAVLAWRYFHPKKPVPYLIEQIEAMDLWKFRPHTREVDAFLGTVEFRFETWDRLVRDFERPKTRAAHLREGRAILRFEQRIVERLIREGARRVRFAGFDALAVNSPYFASDIGAALSRMLSPIGIVWSERHDVCHISLRSNGTVDVSKIAERFGGGGHAAAGGFSWPLGKPLPWKPADRS
jgi:hypothetical protein